MSNTPGTSPIADDIEDIRRSDPSEREIVEGSDADALDEAGADGDETENESDLGD